MAALNGTIKRLVNDKGFGFILATDGNESSSTARRALKRHSTRSAKDKPSPSSGDRGRRDRAAKTSGLSKTALYLRSRCDCD